MRSLDVPVELVGKRVRSGAIAVHQVKLCRLVALQAVVKAGVSDPLSIRRDGGRIVRPFAICERAQCAVGDAELVDFRIKRGMVGFRMAICGNNQISAVGSPFRASRAPFISAIGEIPVCDLPRRTAVCAHYEHLHVARLEITDAVEAIDEPIVRFRWVRPLRARRWARHISEVRTFGGDQRRERKHLSIRRPVDGLGRIFEVGDPRRLAGVHPANINLLFAVCIGKKRDACPVRRPAWRRIASIASRQGAMVRAVGIDNPQVRITFVGCSVRKPPHVNDFLSIGRNLRVRRRLDLKLVHRREYVGRFLCPQQWGGAKNQCRSCCQRNRRGQRGNQTRFSCHQRTSSRAEVNNANLAVSRWAQPCQRCDLL